MALGVLASAPLAASSYVPLRSAEPAEGFVPTAGVAVQIARAILVPIYGKGVIDQEEPLTATLHGDTWEVTGHLPDGARGGVAIVAIAKQNGAILGVYHGK